MGWWPWPSDPRGDAIRSGAATPTRAERQRCWAARDAYFACLDAASILDADAHPAAARAACPLADAALQRDCAAAWVRHFKQWRVADARRRARLDDLRRQGAHEVPVQTSFAPSPEPPPDGPEPAPAKAATRDDIQHLLDRKRAAR